MPNQNPEKDDLNRGMAVVAVADLLFCMQKWVRNQCGRRRTDDLLYQTPQDNKHPLLHHNIHQLMTAAQRGGGRESVNVK